MSHKILVVDDEPEIVKILEKFLRSSGFEVLTAPGGQEAIEILRSPDEIDLMIVDIKMPGVTGINVLGELKESDRKLPVIILSGSIGLQENVNKIKELGYQEKDIVYKPIDLYMLLDMVKKKLPQEV